MEQTKIGDDKYGDLTQDERDVMDLREKLIRSECEFVANMLAEKNRSYGDSALNPVRIMSKSDPVEQIKVRIDDKLSRLKRGKAAGEDVILDLLGYLILLRVATRLQATTNGIPTEFLKASAEAPSIVDVLSDPSGPAAESLFTNGVLAPQAETKPHEWPTVSIDPGSSTHRDDAVRNALSWLWSVYSLTTGGVRRDIRRAMLALGNAPAEDQSDMPPLPVWAQTVRDFATTIMHGDEQHRAWLRQAAERFINGETIDSPPALKVVQRGDEAIVALRNSAIGVQAGLHSKIEILEAHANTLQRYNAESDRQRRDLLAQLEAMTIERDTWKQRAERAEALPYRNAPGE